VTPQDREKLQKAFNAAVQASPYADEVIIGISTKDDKPMTRRMLVERTLKLDAFYDEVDQAISSGHTTLDKLIGDFEQGMKKSIYGGPTP
jgi:hypothetical protein